MPGDLHDIVINLLASAIWSLFSYIAIKVSPLIKKSPNSHVELILQEKFGYMVK